MQITTSRLILRELTKDDFAALYAVLSDSDVTKHYPYTFDENRVRGWIDKNIERYATFGFGLFAVTLKENGMLIGDCGITMQNINGSIKPEIGYHIHKDFRRRGYAKEAALACIEWAFRNTPFKTLYSYMKKENTASSATAMSIGMKKCGEYTDAENEITEVYSVTQSENKHLALRPIATIHTDFPTKFGVPRQSGLVDSLEAQIVFEREFRVPEALRGIEEFSHIWLLWHFSETEEEWSPTVRPPRLGGNRRVGVFATRSPHRPNPIGLSCVRLLGVEKTAQGTTLRVAGADLIDGTPIFDIKPYLPFADSRVDAVGGFADGVFGYSLNVNIPPELLEKIPAEKREALRGVLAGDPRPSYQEDETRVYGFGFCGFEVKFKVAAGTLIVTDII